MHSLTLDTSNRDQLAASFGGGRWIVACLCAAWCGTCGGYRTAFEALAARHPDKTFVWIKRQVDEPIAKQIAALNIKGIYQRKEYKRVYPNGESAAHVRGGSGRGLGVQPASVRRAHEPGPAAADSLVPLPRVRLLETLHGEQGHLGVVGDQRPGVDVGAHTGRTVGGADLSECAELHGGAERVS